MAEYIKSRPSEYLLNINGFLYCKDSDTYTKQSYWLCENAPASKARATTDGGPDYVQQIKSLEEDHKHAPDPNGVMAKNVQASIK